jgi:alkylresorcinol/alkylpyrone synthase
MALPVTILSLATASPPHALDQANAVSMARDLLAAEFPDFDRMSAVFATAGILRRQLAMPLDWYRQPRSFPERAAAYLDCACDLFVAAATRALDAAGLAAGDIDTIVTASSTGIATPSLEARVMGRMGFRRDVARIPVFGLGCAAGATGLSLAARLARGAPGTIVLFVTVELCSLAFRFQDVGKADIIATALFGDGAAAAIVKTGDEGFASITGTAETTWPDTLDIMGWRIENNGLAVVLNRAIPAFARENLRGAMDRALADQGLAVGDIDRFICHPGGAKVVDAIEHALELGQGSLDHERNVLRDHGNMSAPTALFVLDRVRQAGMPPCSVLTALGPGFTMSTVTLRAAA